MHKKKYLIITSLIIILIASFGLVGYYSNNKNTVKYQQQKAGVNIKQRILGTNNSSSSNSSSSPSTQSSGSGSSSGSSNNTTSSGSSPTSGITNIPIEITSTSQTSNTLEIRTQINEITSSGKCTLTMTSGSNSINQSASVQALASISTCEGFNVPLSSLSSGSWTIIINYSSTGQTGSVTKQVNIN